MCFHESEWLRMLFLLSDTQAWLDDMAKTALMQLPVPDKRKFLRKTYYLSLPVLAHILERHYYRINRYPQAGKFTIPVTEILAFIREAHSLPATQLQGCLSFQRVMDAGKIIGFDQDGLPVRVLTILTDAAGRIITAFPGLRPQYDVKEGITMTEEEAGPYALMLRA